MDTANTKFRDLLQRLHNHTASAEDLEILQQLLKDDTAEKELRQVWESIAGNAPFFTPASSEQMLTTILQHRQAPVIPVQKHRYRWMAAAASLLLLLTAGWWFLAGNQRPQKTASISQNNTTVILPGSNKAILTLPNGSAITLDSANNGALTRQGAIQVINQDGRLNYTHLPTYNNATATALYHTLSTPRGGQYMLVLEDGTRVWLNAASSIRYPAEFGDSARNISVTGEAYFEVAHRVRNGKKIPFIVTTGNMQVEVLGTHFNINAYTDEQSINTTLLEGKVQVHSRYKAVILEPGQQARLEPTGNLNVVNNVNTEEVIAWKTGYFQFNRASISAVMRQVARWYDVDVTYEGNIPNRQFGGKISRNSSITEVLKILELSKVHFRTEGKKIIIAD